MEQVRTENNLSRYFTTVFAMKRFKGKKGKTMVRVGFYKSTDTNEVLEEAPEENGNGTAENARRGLEIFTSCKLTRVCEAFRRYYNPWSLHELYGRGQWAWMDLKLNSYPIHKKSIIHMDLLWILNRYGLWIW